MKKNKLFTHLIFGFLLILNFLSPLPVKAATLLSDDFTGTTINTSKWNELDASGAGGTSGNIQQNGSLTVANSFVSNTWGTTALYSFDTFNSTGLELQATISPVSDTLIGYGDYNFQSAGTSAFIIDVQTGGNTLALSWNNGGFDGATSCGSDATTKTYKLKIISGGFEVYKNGSLICTHNTGVTINNKRMFLEASVAASTFDDVLVTGTPSGPTAPGQVTGLTADPGNTQVALSWTAPSNGGSAITDYLIEYKLAAAGSYSTFADGTSTSTSATVTGLTNGQSYNFRVSAINTIGTGTASSVVTSTPTAPSAPGQVTGLTPTTGNTQVALSWTAPASNGSPITDYIVEYKLSSSGTWSTFADGTSTSTSATVTGLTNDLAYNFRVSAVNGIGTGTASSTATATPVAIGFVLTDDFTGTTINTTKWSEVDPGGIGGTVGKVLQNGTLSIRDSYVGGIWGDSALVSQEVFDSGGLEFSAKITAGSSSLIGYGDYAFGGSTAKAYLLYLTGGTGSSILALTWENGSYTSESSCGNSTDGFIYKLKVISGGFQIYENNSLKCTMLTSTVVDDAHVFMETATSAGTFDDVSVYGIQIADTVPGAPTIGTATGGNHQASVTFTPPVSNGGDPITSYTVTSSPGNISATGVSSPIIVTGLTNGQSYTFTVTATNGVGTSSPSSASNSVIPDVPPAPGQVTGLTATGVNQQVLLGWTPVTASDPVTDYKIEYKLSSGSTWSTFSDGVSTSAKAIVTGLVNGSAYDFRVSATNSGGYGAVSSTVSAAPFAITKLGFVITGESNSGGIGLNSDATSGEVAARSAVQIMNLTSGLFGFENLDIGTNNLRDHAGLDGYYDNSHGFELQLANSTEANAFPDNPQVYLVKTGQGGSQVSQWTVGNGSGYWTKFLQRTAAAKTGVPSSGRQWVVWMSLGINDAIAGVPTGTWKTDMVAHINKIKADLPGAIIILTEFQSMTNQSGYATYNAVMDEIAAEQPNVFVVRSTGAALRDTNHLSYAGLKTVTSRMVDVTKTQLGLIYPGLPTGLGATPGNTQVALSWAAPISNGGASITDYKIEYKLSSGSTWSTFSDGVSTSTSATITGLSTGTAYNFRVSAVNINGAGNASPINSTTTDTLAPAISLVTSTPSDTGAVITWSTDENASSSVEYGITSSYGATTSEIDLSPRVSSHSVTLSGLSSCTTYYYRVLSTDSAANTATGSQNSFITTGCTTPVITTITSRGRPPVPQTPIAPSNHSSSSSSNTPGSPFVFTKNLIPGNKSSDIKRLQEFLNAQGFIISVKGAGSPGKETTTFGPATKAAVKKFQKKYGIPQTGTVGPLTRAKIGTF